MIKQKIGFLILIIYFISNTIFSFAQKNNSHNMIMVKGGSFKMGANDGYDDEKPVHNVSLSDFYICKYETTVAQYRAFCMATGRKMPADPNEAWYEEHDMVGKWIWVDNNPITNITWYDAEAYCKWLSEISGETYKLPTEAQWEFAARGGLKSKGYKYSGSNNIKEVSWFDETTNEKGPKPVGKLKSNELGIYDMSGNAWEWCADKYGKYTSAVAKDPQGTDKGAYRVIRGGSWYYVEEMSRVTARDGPYPYYTNYNYGFRVAKK